MSLLKTYTSTANFPNGINIEFVNKEINNASCVTSFDYALLDGDELKIYGGAISNETELDSIVSNHVPCIPYKNEFIINLSIDSVYGNTDTTYSYIPIQIMLPTRVSINEGATKLEAKIMVSYETDGASTGELQLYNYTDTTEITTTQTALENSTWTFKETPYFDLTEYEGKAIRIGCKRIGGTASDAVKIESVSFFIKTT